MTETQTSESTVHKVDTKVKQSQRSSRGAPKQNSSCFRCGRSGHVASKNWFRSHLCQRREITLCQPRLFYSRAMFSFNLTVNPATSPCPALSAHAEPLSEGHWPELTAQDESCHLIVLHQLPCVTGILQERLCMRIDCTWECDRVQIKFKPSNLIG